MVTTLSISSTYFSDDCNEIIAQMKRLGFIGDVSCNKTIIDNKVENGCRVMVTGEQSKHHAKLLWFQLKSIYNLSCAHVKVEHKNESGCVFDVFRESDCPGNRKS